MDAGLTQVSMEEGEFVVKLLFSAQEMFEEESLPSFGV